jgi:hypothetical protein
MLLSLHSGFCPVCIRQHSRAWLGICLVPNIYTIIILHNVLLLTCSLSYLLFLLWFYGTSIKYHIILPLFFTNMWEEAGLQIPPAINGRPLGFCLDIQVSVNCLYHAWMVLSVGGSFAYFAQNARCTVTTDLLVWYSNTQNDFSPGAAIFSLHTLAAPSGRNVN